MSKAGESTPVPENTAIQKLTASFDSLLGLCTRNADMLQPKPLVVEDIEKENRSLREQIAIARDETRKISIGIVGQVKSGKSAFLNALFFDGEKLLPTAATPMTAALTILGHIDDAEQKEGLPRGAEHAIVHFYNRDDWSRVESMAREFQDAKDALRVRMRKEAPDRSVPDDVALDLTVTGSLGEDFKAAVELLDFAEKIPSNERGVLLGKEKCITFSDHHDLAKQLGDYVGSAGTYTALTKYIELYLNIDTLRGITVVDTPGMNDPIVSRGFVTERYLKQCDAAFVLSYAGQFMGKSDSDYILDMLPNEGIRRITVLGSKFDSVLLDVSKEYRGNLPDAARKTAVKLEAAARQILEKGGKSGGRIIEIKFISGMLHSIARTIARSPEQLSEEQVHIQGRLKSTYRDFQAAFDSPEMLMEIANVEQVKTGAFAAVRADKQAILDQKLADILEAKTKRLAGYLRDLQTWVEGRKQEISSADIAALKKQLKAFTLGIELATGKIEQAFETAAEQTRYMLEDLCAKIEDTASEFRDFAKGTTVSRTETRTVRVAKTDGPFGGNVARAFGSLFRTNWGYTSETEHYDVTYAKLRPVIDNIINFINSSKDEVKNVFRRHLQTIKPDSENGVGKLGSVIIDSIVKNIDTSSDSYDVRKVNLIIIKALRKMNYTELNMDSSEYTKYIESTFSSETKDVDKVRKALSDAINKALARIKDEVKQTGSGIIRTLEEGKHGFAEELKKMFSEDTHRLTEQVQYKEHYLGQMDVFLKELQALIRSSR